jgi:hypothetical protein
MFLKNSNFLFYFLLKINILYFESFRYDDFKNNFFLKKYIILIYFNIKNNCNYISPYMLLEMAKMVNMACLIFN